MRLFTVLALVATLLTLSARAHPARATERGEAIFAGGCFWCEEASLEKVSGVLSVVSGYTGGTKLDPTYEEVSGGSTGHAESVKVTFDPTKVTYAHLLEVFWHNVDPTSASGQFCDRGNQYRSAIFYLDDAQKKAAEASKAEVEKKLKIKVATEITAAAKFYPAEDYHQDFYKKNPVRYSTYRLGCGRDRRLHDVWGSDGGSH